MTTTPNSPAPTAIAGNGMAVAFGLLMAACVVVVLFAESAEPAARTRQTSSGQHY